MERADQRNQIAVRNSGLAESQCDKTSERETITGPALSHCVCNTSDGPAGPIAYDQSQEDQLIWLAVDAAAL